MRDMMTHCTPKRCISPAAATTDNTAWVGQIIDIQGYDSLTYLIETGSLADADATFTVLLEESDASDMSGAAAVADVDLLGTEALASFTFADDNKCFKLGYVGNKRYTRLTITPANNSGNAFVAAIALLGHPAQRPTANPPA
ncbi:hypothetical protein D9623_33645 (plasmid) [Azospirillum brasilense]|uniref:Uncharacterized protein n=1 Tax=Azospirillum brasilense TaxID=192 RepID=A0A4D8QUR5_AZOBR|nr:MULTISPECIES: hypothetical protein [Azospirillum]YP_001686875.1 hypothetical protein APCd_gp34 [Azospirillum phage Cd]MDW7555386.1 hypothetical protein [Azospirillum brasilense]MDW7595206.1 hypothetical protein [Azospirillum brasilense]MDW7630359.1 hypothetical protein [Azospirillum brasilense]MDX5949727.1 hypothetical protein [Azospirillum brasilense]OPH16858.1 hypothetical protein FE89_02560 [Azospirillum brasilense]